MDIYKFYESLDRDLRRLMARLTAKATNKSVPYTQRKLVGLEPHYTNVEEAHIAEKIIPIIENCSTALAD